MNENIKTFSLVVITICVFIMTVIDILQMMEEKKTRPAPQTSSLTTTTQPAPVTAPVHSTAPEVANQPKTSIKFEEKVFDFGNINQGDVVKHKFVFTNTGNSPLVISEAHGSCGCTIPSYPKEPIAPGGRSEVEVQFNSAGKEGMQNKSVTVTANTDPPQTIINVISNVKPKS